MANINKRISDTKELLKELGLPQGQQNDRSALTLLALLDLKPRQNWNEAKISRLGVTPIMDWCRNNYKKHYMPNSRESFRKQTLKQFVEAGICVKNPDDPHRATNSSKNCYEVTELAIETIKMYKKDTWESALANFFKNQKSLIEQYAKKRDMAMIPLIIGDEVLKLTPGKHHELIKKIINEFGPLFAPGSDVVYIGDTGQKDTFFEFEILKELGITVDTHGKWPDVILYSREKNWIYLIESVTSVGPMDNMRLIELNGLFKDCSAGLIFVTAFLDKKTMVKFIPEISWETEIWLADSPTHMIHLNGDRFMGPHK